MVKPTQSVPATAPTGRLKTIEKFHVEQNEAARAILERPAHYGGEDASIVQWARKRVGDSGK